MIEIKKVSGKTVEELEDADEKEALKKVEAVLFVTGRFLSVQELISFTDLNPIILKEILNKLSERYDSNDSAIEIISRNDLWKMDVRQDYSKITTRLATGSSEFSSAEKETLAIIAYKQPIKQSVVIKIRGNKAYDHIKKFLDLGLIKSKKLGHTNELFLSDEFYDYFSLEKRSDGGFERIEDLESEIIDEGSEENEEKVLGEFFKGELNNNL